LNAQHIHSSTVAAPPPARQWWCGLRLYRRPQYLHVLAVTPPSRLFNSMYSSGWPVAPPPARSQCAQHESPPPPPPRTPGHAPPSHMAVSASTSITGTLAMSSAALLRCMLNGAAICARRGNVE
jgi:hypothetical protein